MDKPKDNSCELSVLYNSACPVCKSGIEMQARRMRGHSVQWIDIHSNKNALKYLGTDIEKVRERPHVVSIDDGMQVGLDAFIALWQRSPKDAWKAKAFSLPVIRVIADKLYKVFARRLYRWNRARGHW